MPLPLYQIDQRYPSANDDNIKSPNGGLWFEKFYRDYNNDFSETLTTKTMFGDVTKTKFINKDGIKKANSRQKNLISCLKGSSKIFKTVGSFVTGLGQNHPTENGFAWHPTLSAPFIAGSAVKGLLRHWMKHYRQEAYAQVGEYWFGNEQADNENQSTGNLMFFDALPANDNIMLTAEIMTPHFGKWYSEGSKGDKTNAPHDAHMPVPIKFLAVQKASFLFSIAPRNSQDELECQHAKIALDELGYALEFLGAGAKTATGFGKMSIDDKAQKAEQEAKTSELSKKAKSLTTQFLSEGGQPNAASGNDIFKFITELNIEGLSIEEVADIRILMKTYKPSSKKEKEFKSYKNAFNARFPE